MIAVLVFSFLLPAFGASGKSAEVDANLKQLFQMNHQLKKLVKDRRQIEKDRGELSSKAELLDESIRTMEMNIRENRKVVADTLLGSKRKRKESMVSVLLRSESPASLDRQMRTLDTLRRYHLLVLRSYILGRNQLKQDHQELQEAIEKLASSEAILRERELAVQQKYDSKKSLLADLRKSKQATIAKLKMIQGKDGPAALEARQIEESIVRPSLIERQGRLFRPVPTQASIKYGSFVDRDLRIHLPHAGVFFPAEDGTEVRSVAAGKVAAIIDIQGLGSSVVLDHGDHFFSVYGGVDQVRFAEGQRIPAGETIARTAYSALYNTTGLYFEIRHYSEPQDPRRWLKGDKVK